MFQTLTNCILRHEIGKNIYGHWKYIYSYVQLTTTALMFDQNRYLKCVLRDSHNIYIFKFVV